MVKIRLKRMGTKKRPDYRIVVIDSRAAQNGATIEEVGEYHPISSGEQSKVKEDRVKYWLSVGAQPTEIVKKILNKNGLSAAGKNLSK